MTAPPPLREAGSRAPLANSAKPRLERASTIGFVIVASCFAVAGVLLSAHATWSGTWDSLSNIETARNLASGRGFVARSVQNLVEPIALPGPETIRPPGAVFLLAAAYRLFGTGNWVHVALNVATILATAAVVRAAARSVAGAAWGNAAGLLVLLAPRSYELLSFWNNNLLTLLVAAALLLALRADQSRIRGPKLALLIGVLAAAAFLTKQSYVLSFALLAMILVGAERGTPAKLRIRNLLVAGAVGALCSAVYWVPNLVHHGALLYSPAQALHLPIRYGLIPLGESGRTVLFDRAPFTYAEIAATIGWKGILKRELSGLRDIAAILLRQAGPLVVWVALTLALITRRRWRVYTACAALMVSPVFDASYWVAEPRYLAPVYVPLVIVAVLGVAEIREWEGVVSSEALRRRALVVFALVGAAHLLYTVYDVQAGWRSAARQARTAPPAWASAVSRVDRGAVVLTGLPPFVNHWADRMAVIAPVGPRRDLEKVLATYHPTHYLYAGEPPSLEPPFRADELVRIDAGPDWALYRIRPSASDMTPQGSTLAPASHSPSR